MALSPIHQMALSPSESQSDDGTVVMKTTPCEDEIRPWIDLPRDLLSPIALRLGIIDLNIFRGVCKDWHCASSTASAEIESSPDRKPWFLLYGDNSKCLLYDYSNQKPYSKDVPELVGSTCLASKQGWLLVFREGSIFFLCPFSHAKIDLPNFPHLVLTDHVATLSSPPTSKDCIVCVINRRDALTMELNVITRGEEKWTKIDYASSKDTLETVTGASYHNGSFYFIDSYEDLITYSVNRNTCKMYKIVDNKDKSTKSEDYLPFAYKVSYFKKCEMKNHLGLEDDASIATCGTSMIVMNGTYQYDVLINNERFEGSGDSKTKFLKGVWIHPRSFRIAPNQSWSL